MTSLREIMTKSIRLYGWLDYCYERGDNKAKEFDSYEAWLSSLDDEDFLDTYNRVRESESRLD